MRRREELHCYGCTVLRMMVWGPTALIGVVEVGERFISEERIIG